MERDAEEKHKRPEKKQLIVSPQKVRYTKNLTLKRSKDLGHDRVISIEDMKFFDDNGYLIIRNAVPDDMCDAVVQSIYKFGNMSPTNPPDWYRPPIAFNGFVEMYHQQAMWNTRQHPRIYKAFSELWNTGKLWVSIDRVCMKPPSNPNHKSYDHRGFVHWDLVRIDSLPLLTDLGSLGTEFAFWFTRSFIT
jgi:hypothetical protein